YVGCESGAMTYVQEDILDMHSYFSQHAVLTMSTADGSEFTAEFDVPFIYDRGFTHLKNISYSDNAPNDFRRRFEDIFVNDEPVYSQYCNEYQTKKLNDGKFYLNGNSESCYFEVNDGKIQLVIENDKQAREYFETEMENTDNEAFRGASYDQWYISVTNHWDEPSDYEIIPTWLGLRIAFWVSYDSDGKRSSYSGVEYIDSDHIIYSDCTFTRV
ncbi:MAG: Bsp6I family type II restriction endonuclease, partial [Oscillospiraceae bacterium]|nr:Bsp6I family type II restriction endonuclease [Oscillospiraceae bacterium]